MDPLLLPVHPDVGRALGGLGRTKVYELLASGELPSVRIGRRRFVPAAAVAQYVARLAQDGATADEGKDAWPP